MTEYLRLKKSNCKNCYKCIRHCPVKSIRFSAGQAHIVTEECILCGQCFVVCPQNAKQITDSTEKVKVMLQGMNPVYASVAPSFAANYAGVGIGGLESALKKLGFAGAEETAVGATIVKKEYERQLREDKPDILISSCCHSVNLLIQKHYPACLKYLAKVMSPMQAHCADIKRRHPDAKTVFIGPCVAKKDEADHFAGLVDAVMTFEELTNWMNDEGVVPECQPDSNEESRARLFPTSGGILKTMDCDQPDYQYLVIDGTENCIAALEDIENGNLKGCFIEMSACAGSCIGGPVMEKYRHSPIKNYTAVSKYAGSIDFPVDAAKPLDILKNIEIIESKTKMPTETEINDILRRMGKLRPDQELNCGSCGYETCRDKAVAIYQGKAEISMCLPYLMEKAESFSDTIINNSPNAIVVLNEELEVQQVNPAACQMLRLRSDKDVLGEDVGRILDSEVFKDVRDRGKTVKSRHIYLSEYNTYISQTIIHDREYHVIICMMRDITEKELENKKKEEISDQAVEIADRVVDKQMRIVQEIASLLGETAAETKIALTKLKEVVSDE